MGGKFLMVQEKKKKKRNQPKQENTLGVFQSARSYRESS